MEQIKITLGKVKDIYKMLGFWNFLEYSSSYFLMYVKSKTQSTKNKITREKFKILYADAISSSKTTNDIFDIVEIYCKRGTLKTFDYSKLSKKNGKIRMNQILIGTILTFKPNLIHLIKSELLFDSTIKKIKDEIDIYTFVDTKIQRRKYLKRHEFDSKIGELIIKAKTHQRSHNYS